VPLLAQPPRQAEVEEIHRVVLIAIQSAADAIAKQEQQAHAAAAAATTPAQKQRLQALDQALAAAASPLPGC